MSNTQHERNNTHQYDIKYQQQKIHLIVYPYQIVQLDREIQEIDKQLYRLMKEIKEKKIEKERKREVGMENGMMSEEWQIGQQQLQREKLKQQWKRDDEISDKNKKLIENCQQFYQARLHEEQIRHIEMRDETKQRLQARIEQNQKLQQQITQMQKQFQATKQKVKKMEVDTEQTKKFRAGQKQKITNMLIHEKQQLYTKYTQIQEEGMIVLKFIQRVQEIIQKKPPQDRQDEPGRISYIKQIQLEASKFYASLANPMIQQLLNAITQVINLLNKKFQKLDKMERSANNSRNSIPMPSFLNLKPVEKQKVQKKEGSSIFQLKSLKEQYAKMTKKHEDSMKQLQNSLDFEKQKSMGMKKKIQKLQDEIEQRNKEMIAIKQKQQDTTKKVKWLEQQILDYERKLKMQNEEMEIYQKGASMENLNNQKKPSPQKSQIHRSLSLISMDATEFHSSKLNQTAKKQDLQKLNTEVHNLTRELLNKMEQQRKMKKIISELESKLAHEKQESRRKVQQLTKLKLTLSQKTQNSLLIQKQLKKTSSVLKQKTEYILKLEEQVAKAIQKIKTKDQEWQNNVKILKTQLKQSNEKILQVEKKNQLILLQKYAKSQQYDATIAKKQAQCDEKQQKIEKLQEQLAQSRIACRQNQDQLQNLKLKLNEKQQWLTQLSKRLDQQIEEKNKKIQTIQSQLTNFNSILIQKDKQLKEVETKSKQYQQNKILQQNIIRQLQTKNNETVEKISNYEQNLNAKQNQTKQLENKIIQLERQISSLKQEIQKQIQNRHQENLKNSSHKMSSQLQFEKYEQLAHSTHLKHTSSEHKEIIYYSPSKQSDNMSNEHEMDQQDNLSQSKQLSIMHSQIKNFKEQLNQLYKTIQLKEDQIAHLKKQSEGTLKKEKQTYQIQLLKNNVKIMELQDQILKLTGQLKDSPRKKRKASSSKYFSGEPSHNFWSKQGKTQEKENAANIKAFRLNKKQSTQDNQEDSYHSCEEDFVQNQNNKQQTENFLATEPLKKGVRREKSHQYERNFPKPLRLHKMVSIQRCYHDSDQKSKEQKQKKCLPIPTPLTSGRVSPIVQKTEKNSDTKYSANVKIFKQGPKQSHEQLPQITHSSNSVMNNEQLMRTISQQNKHLKNLNEKLTKDIFHLSQFFTYFEKRWKNLKITENNSESHKLIPIQKIQQNLKILNHDKIKLLEQFSTLDLETFYDNITQIVGQTKKWIDIIETLSHQNKRMTLQMLLLKSHSKLVKTKTMKTNQGQEPIHRKQREVYSEGNVAKERNLIDDFSPFEIHQELHLHPNMNQNQPSNNNATNSLQILFKQNNEMSQISSVKHNSYNSSFFNSRSQIAKMFEKGQKLDKDHKEKEMKRDENRKDIVDEYVMMNQNLKGEKQKLGDKNKSMHFNTSTLYNAKDSNSNKKIPKSNNSQINPRMFQSRIQSNNLQNSPIMHKNNLGVYLPTNNIEALKKFQEKSNKSKRKIMSKTILRLSTINMKLAEDRKEFINIVKTIVNKYQQKISHLQTQFNLTLKKIITNSITIQQSKRLILKIKNQKENSLLSPSISISPPQSLTKTTNLKVEIPSSLTKAGTNNRISEKDEQTEEKIQEMENIIEKQKKEIENRNKNIAQIKEQMKELQKKLKEEKTIQENFKNQYLTQVTLSMQLKARIQKMDQDFKGFINKIMLKNMILNGVQSKAIDSSSQQPKQPKSPTISIIQAMPQNQLKKLFSKKSGENLKISETIPYESPQSVKNEIKPSSNEKIEEKVQVKQNQQQKIEKQENLPNKFEQKKPQINQKETPEIPQRKSERNESRQSETEYRVSKIKSQQEPKRDQRKQRNSDKGLSDLAGKSLKISDFLSNFLPPTQSIAKKPTISQASEKQRIEYYKLKLSDINQKVQEILLSQFRKTSSGNELEISEKISKDKYQSESKIKNGEQNKEIDQNKEKHKKDQEQIIQNLNLLEGDLISLREETIKRANEKEQRLKQIIKSIILLFKISKRSIEKIIDGRQRKENNFMKYLNVRVFFKSLYDNLSKRDSQIRLDSFTNFDSIQTENVPIEGTQPLKDNQQLLRQFQSFEDKQNELIKQNSKLKTQLQQRIIQIQALHEAKQKSYPQNQLKKKNTVRHSLNSNENEQKQFEQFENRQLYDNTKPSLQMMEQLKKQLQIYKNKCQQYESMQSKKKNCKEKYIRKW